MFLWCFCHKGALCAQEVSTKDTVPTWCVTKRAQGTVSRREEGQGCRQSHSRAWTACRQRVLPGPLNGSFLLGEQMKASRVTDTASPGSLPHSDFAGNLVTSPKLLPEWRELSPKLFRNGAVGREGGHLLLATRGLRRNRPGFRSLTKARSSGKAPLAQVFLLSPTFHQEHRTTSQGTP